MIEHIKQIGLFMIVTQTFIHVAAGKQYEKYVKIIAGVIVLLLFVRPFFLIRRRYHRTMAGGDGADDQ